MTIDEIRKLCEDASPGPWSSAGGARCAHPYNLVQIKKDGAFIDMARDVLPKLLAVAEALEKVLPHTTCETANHYDYTCKTRVPMTGLCDICRAHDALAALGSL